MKKILCALLASLMVLSFAGCKIESTADADTDKPAVEQPADETPDEEPVVDEPVEEAPVEEEPVEEVASTFTPGEINGNVYTNEYAGLTFNAPDGWTYMSDEELAEMMNLSIDLVSDGNEYLQKLAELTTVYGMVAQSGDMLSNVQVMFENTTITGNKMSGEAYAKILSTQLGGVYEQMDATATIGDIETVQIGDNEYYYLSISVDLGGITLEQGYACQRFDDYIASIVITAYEEGGAKAILEYFE